MAAVYPKRLCQLFGQDLWCSLRRDAATSCRPWPPQLLWMHGIYYSCERCQLGRSAPPGCEHTLVPGQCRYGQPGMRRSRSLAAPEAPQPPRDALPPTHDAPQPPSTQTAAPSSIPGSTPAPSRSDLEDVTGPFKFLARNGDYSMVKLVCDSSVQLSGEARLYLKAALLNAAHLYRPL